MAISPSSPRRFVVAAGIAAAIAAAPALTVLSIPSQSLASCPNGETEDTFTNVCVPDIVPNSPGNFSSVAGNPNLPAVNAPDGGGAIPCTGANSGECIGLAEEQQSEGPQPVPQSTVGSSPTVHGSIG
ncbi:intersectin-EH binding protein Ibp1 [Mycolicibacterium peregrinum]|uniref:Intersectin-EH binding protein Ibp1 n=1 Tax=Mycolicibacterium peregrinum TaxID=43304 RepID=A0A4Z0HI37_MYCPR|nr:intersectin-EH binding protein Ibp1 [Mycolicibacterium peregrinum]TGB38190.1 intersectin-EH binding protein Ibp1 [Mycolicibacterium peregrinum]TGB38281.1 intersectin-EH binding protein Ibp1 [Mycolicibacterium peregrinum]